MRAGEAERIDVLLFTLRGVRFGVPAEQVLATGPYPGEEEAPLRLDEAIGFGPQPALRLAGTVLTVRSGRGRERVLVDAVEEIAEFSTDDLRPFPALMEPFCLRRGVWGVLLGNGGAVLLLDFPMLLRQREKAPGQAAPGTVG